MENVKKNQDLINLKIENLVVGDLIYDTYLRFKPSPTVNLSDPYLWFLIWNSFASYRNANKYFSKNSVRLYLTSYTTYINNGIPVRVALKHGVKVVSFGNAQNFCKFLSKDDSCQTKNCNFYLDEFNSLADKAEKIQIAGKRLGERIGGAIDNSILYMKSSSYHLQESKLPDIKNASIIFLHDFYDSPHIYPYLIFPDFLMWVKHTVNFFIERKIPFFIKPHPNSLPENANVLRELEVKYGKEFFLPKEVSNIQLVNGGIACAITAYGTIAHEMAFLGIPSVAAGYNPHIAFDFCKTPSTIQQYEGYLLSQRRGFLNLEDAKIQSKIFYFMHNLALSKEELDLNTMAMSLRMLAGQEPLEVSLLRCYLDKLMTMQSSLGFKFSINKFCELIEG